MHCRLDHVLWHDSVPVRGCWRSWPCRPIGTSSLLVRGTAWDHLLDGLWDGVRVTGTLRRNKISTPARSGLKTVNRLQPDRRRHPGRRRAKCGRSCESRTTRSRACCKDDKGGGRSTHALIVNGAKAVMSMECGTLALTG